MNPSERSKAIRQARERFTGKSAVSKPDMNRPALQERLAKLEAIIKRQGKLNRPTCVFEDEAEQLRKQLAALER